MSADTKTKLLDVAEAQVRQKGADGFSYADLSDAVGIRKASIHYHFPVKSDLLTAIMIRYADTVLAALNSFTDEKPTAGAQILAFTDVYKTALSGGTSLCLCVAFTVSNDGMADGTRAAILDFRASVHDWLVATFKTAKTDGTIMDVADPEAEAASALALVEGAQIAARLGESVGMFDAACKHLTDRLVV